MCHSLQTFLSKVDESLLDEQTKMSIRHKLIVIFQTMPDVHTNKLRQTTLCVNPNFLVNILTDFYKPNKQDNRFLIKYESQLKPIFDKLNYRYHLS